METRTAVAGIIVTACLFFFGILMWKKPEKIAIELKYDKRLKRYPPEYREGAKAAYLGQMRAVGLGIFMGGIACAVLFTVLAVNPSLIGVMSVGG